MSRFSSFSVLLSLLLFRLSLLILTSSTLLSFFPLFLTPKFSSYPAPNPLLPTGHPAPRQLDQASRLPPTPRSGRWERGVGGSLARDLALIGGGRGGQLLPAKPGTSAFQTHQPPRQQGGSRTRTRADDSPDEAPNHPADDFANYFPDYFRRLRRWVHVNRSLRHLASLTRLPQRARTRIAGFARRGRSRRMVLLCQRFLVPRSLTFRPNLHSRDEAAP